MLPSIAATSGPSTLPPPNAMLWSSRLSPSRMLPAAARAMAFKPGGVERDALGRADLLELRLNLRRP